jgi:cytochrome b subunit of formate dehydrogenase
MGFIALVFGAVLVITGVIMWFFKELTPSALLQWMVIFRDVAFIVSSAILFAHVYLSFHPLIRPLRSGPWNSMIGLGKVPVEYAKSYHGKWYNEVSKVKKGV